MERVIIENKCIHEFRLVTQGFCNSSIYQSSIIQCIKCLKLYRQDKDNWLVKADIN
jgi:hypothetical protein